MNRIWWFHQLPRAKVWAWWCPWWCQAWCLEPLAASPLKDPLQWMPKWTRDDEVEIHINLQVSKQNKTLSHDGRFSRDNPRVAGVWCSESWALNMKWHSITCPVIPRACLLSRVSADLRNDGRHAGLRPRMFWMSRSGMSGMSWLSGHAGYGSLQSGLRMCWLSRLWVPGLWPRMPGLLWLRMSWMWLRMLPGPRLPGHGLWPNGSHGRHGLPGRLWRLWQLWQLWQLWRLWWLWRLWRLWQLWRLWPNGWQLWLSDGLPQPDGMPDGLSQPDGLPQPDGLSQPDGLWPDGWPNVWQWVSWTGPNGKLYEQRHGPNEWSQTHRWHRQPYWWTRAPWWADGLSTPRVRSHVIHTRCRCSWRQGRCKRHDVAGLKDDTPLILVAYRGSRTRRRNRPNARAAVNLSSGRFKLW